MPSPFAFVSVRPVSRGDDAHGAAEHLHDLAQLPRRQLLALRPDDDERIDRLAIAGLPAQRIGVAEVALPHPGAERRVAGPRGGIDAETLVARGREAHAGVRAPRFAGGAVGVQLVELVRRRLQVRGHLGQPAAGCERMVDAQREHAQVGADVRVQDVRLQRAEHPRGSVLWFEIAQRERRVEDVRACVATGHARAARRYGRMSTHCDQVYVSIPPFFAELDELGLRPCPARRGTGRRAPSRRIPTSWCASPS